MTELKSIKGQGRGPLEGLEKEGKGTGSNH
jgi:hypothetical protein